MHFLHLWLETFSPEQNRGVIAEILARARKAQDEDGRLDVYDSEVSRLFLQPIERTHSWH